jgi:hypothetical protein
MVEINVYKGGPAPKTEEEKRLASAERVADKFWPVEPMGEGPYFEGSRDAQEYVTASLRLALGMDTTLPARLGGESEEES